MSIERSLYVGLSGMNVQGQTLNVIGDNIANLNTIGFKSGRSAFEEMLGQSLVGGSGQLGGGVGGFSVDRMFSQGALLGTGKPTDLAISGDGFFAVEGTGPSGAAGQFLTRVGTFSKDREGFLSLGRGGPKLLGYGVDGNGDIGSTVGVLQIDDSPYPPKATNDVKLQVGLNGNWPGPVLGADGKELVPQPPPPDVNLNENNGSHFTSQVTVYDAVGNPIEATVHFTRVAHDNDTYTWRYDVTVPSNEIEGGAADTKFSNIGTGNITFDGKGQIVLDPAQPPPTFAIQPKGAGNPTTISLDFAGSKQYAAGSATLDVSQDGNQSGTFQELRVDQDGKVYGTFDNGKERLLGQAALARVRSVDGVRSAGGGLYLASHDSGAVTFGAPGTGGRGTIQGGALEQSNVDLAGEFAQLILAQRGYQANTRTISTADQMMQEAMNLKRS